ncbi:hypothetical protein DFR33_101190 [Bradymonas sediminis]|nr:hypothetical protein DFR33_101190 [Bradymonas sediminis]
MACPISRGDGVVEGSGDKGIQFPFISEAADEALEIIFEHADGIASEHLARALGFKDCDFLIEELDLAGIHIRRQTRRDTLYYLAPLRFPAQGDN